MLKNKRWIWHAVFTLIFWACFLMLPFLFFPHHPFKPALESKRFVVLYIFSMLYLASFYYFNSYVLIPKLLAHRRPVLYTFTNVFFFLLYLTSFYFIWRYAPETINLYKKRDWSFGPWRFNFFSFGPMIMFLLAFTFSSVSKILSRWLEAEDVKAEISKQQLQTELTLLRAQVNPHFLFNTLNSIYSLTLNNNAKAPDAVMKLSHIMRYTLEESQSEYVDLKHELSFIESYLELQKLRATDKVKINYSVEGNFEHVKISPLLLIPFIENAFKYGVSVRMESEIDVRIQILDDAFVFACINDIMPNAIAKRGTGTGIANVKRRLDLLYTKRYELDIQSNENKYSVKLRLNI